MLRPELCKGCKHGPNGGSHEKQSHEWNYKDCTKLVTTDCHGILDFPGSFRKKANVTRIIPIKLNRI